MTCAQGLLRLLWGGGGPKLECYGTGSPYFQSKLRAKVFFFCKSIFQSPIFQVMFFKEGPLDLATRGGSQVPAANEL